MHEINKLIDFSTWTGNWPFYNLRYREMNVLKNKLRSLNIIKAFISPIESILEQDPIRANIHLLKNINDDFFSPVIVVDMSYANWGEAVNMAINDKRVKMIKLLPNYHMYDFSEDNIASLIDITQKNNLLISVEMRVEDSRGQYSLMKVEDMDAQQIVKTISYFPGQIFIINNCYITDDIKGLVFSVENAYIDLSSLEHHNNILKHLRETIGLEKILFSSHCPFYYPEGNLYKLKYADLPIDEIEKVAFKNGEELLKNFSH